MMMLDSRPTPTPGVLGSLIDNEAVLVLPAQGQVKVLNEVGARVWSLADGHRTVRELIAIICSEYAVRPEQAEADICTFLAELASRGVISLDSLLES